MEDRCDIEFTYKTTNSYLDYIVGTPSYFVNAGDTYSITLKNIKPTKVVFKTNSFSLDLTGNEYTYSAIIPTKYTDKEGFAIILNDSIVLYQGLLNYTMTNVNDLESQVSINTKDISLLKIEYDTINDTLNSFIDSTNAKLQDLEERVSTLEKLHNN